MLYYVTLRTYKHLYTVVCQAVCGLRCDVAKASEHFPYSSLIQVTTENTNAPFAILNVDVARYNIVKGCALPVFFHTIFASGLSKKSRLTVMLVKHVRYLNPYSCLANGEMEPRHVQTLQSEFEWHNMLQVLFSLSKID